MGDGWPSLTHSYSPTPLSLQNSLCCKISVPKKALALSFAVLQEVTHSALQSQLVTGYSTWTSLKNDIESSNGGGTFNLCPGSVLDAIENPTTTNDWRWIYITDGNSCSGMTFSVGIKTNIMVNAQSRDPSNHHFAIERVRRNHHQGNNIQGLWNELHLC